MSLPPLPESIAARVSPTDHQDVVGRVAAGVPAGRNVFRMPASDAARFGRGVAAATSPAVRAMAAAMPRVRRRMQGAYAVLTGTRRRRYGRVP